MKEVWKDVEGYEGLYQISNLGKVKTLAREIKSSNRKKIIYKRIYFNRKYRQKWIFYSHIKQQWN